MHVQAMGRARPRRLRSAGGQQQRSIGNPVRAAVRQWCRDVCPCRRSAIFAQVVDGGVTSRCNGKMALFRDCRCLVGSLICL
ncbi:unknown protein [Oryza sativa Japonica Group]|uniref:Os05g0296900 protein n=3 Tax=Oryza sativa TaxID=4530 RepID=A0A0P0V4I6_ORYSJ|nr:hypothetical protein OsI_19340 [Oryza sativa Indica Group]EEE54851.1 hypothetical protein OsJ_02316 [Oryza sativa Japonica Group]KAB8081969.1 hypothetical protein EE612_003645 [Oryza sativa]KAF2930044.1 hypothetical protein DAI22_05g102400 [Oryza sativa Japonica Group]KAF2950853.1 hypothetical protein DAI22_01g217200 [Oryza sativa Japonica Group]|eukprot:NP_001055118.2 Os05g0296900 [Oryza sativa Japonica Group]